VTTGKVNERTNGMAQRKADGDMGDGRMEEYDDINGFIVVGETIDHE